MTYAVSGKSLDWLFRVATEAPPDFHFRVSTFAACERFKFDVEPFGFRWHWRNGRQYPRA